MSMAFQEPVFFLTGMNFPLSKLPSLLTLGAAIIPISLGLDALRQLLFPGQITGVFPPAVEMLILLVIGIIFVIGAYVMLRRMEWLAKVEARLSLRWQ